MRKVLERCPTCGGELTISGMQCHACHTRIESQYSTCPFCRLQQQSLDFIEIFVKSRGNIKEMERELGISYPTVRNRLNAVISELGYEVGAQPSSQDERGEERGEILKQLNDGKISAADAAELIRQLRRK